MFTSILYNHFTLTVDILYSDCPPLSTNAHVSGQTFKTYNVPWSLDILYSECPPLNLLLNHFTIKFGHFV